jgi:hypothetical protein
MAVIVTVTNCIFRTGKCHKTTQTLHALKVQLSQTKKIQENSAINKSDFQIRYDFIYKGPEFCPFFQNDYRIIRVKMSSASVR